MFRESVLTRRQISKIVMMAAKDVRPLLVALAADSLISTQEVPKSADRNPTRTFYLWYVDLQKASSVILGNTYNILGGRVAGLLNSLAEYRGSGPFATAERIMVRQAGKGKNSVKAQQKDVKKLVRYTRYACDLSFITNRRVVLMAI